MQIELNSNERKLLLDALRQPAYKDKISHPATKFLIRKVYKELIEKLESDELLSREIKKTISDKAIEIPGKGN